MDRPAESARGTLCAPRQGFKIIAHRGASAEAADNSPEAFELALEQGADLIETDLRITADGVLVLEHDAKVEDLEVRYTSYAQLKERRPHLLSLATLKRYGERIPFCFEIKSSGIENAVVYLVKDLLSEAMWQRTEFTSFNLPSAVACHHLARERMVGWLTGEWSEEAIYTLQKLALPQICPRAASVLQQPELVQTSHEAGLTVRVWLVETPDVVAELARLGVYGGTVNFPAAAREALLSR